jgi:predicted cation transporter
MLTVILAALTIFAVLIGPIAIKPIERNVEIFFLVVGVLIAGLMGQFSTALIRACLREPLSFTLAVMVFGAGFHLLRDYLDRLLAAVVRVIDRRMICFCLTILLGLLAPLITPVVSALIFVEAISALHLERATETAVTVFACFAIGFGAGLTPLGLPGIAVVLRALHADFWYLARLLGPFVVVGVILAAVPSLFLPFDSIKLHPTAPNESWRVVLLTRPGRVYLFIAGLVALSEGLRPVVDAYISRLPDGSLFWLNTISAVVNNSTLAVVEIGPTLSLHQQRAALLGLLISGGMLMPGNIPNIVAASRLRITSREWARIGLGTGIALLMLCFAVLSLMTGHL